jgi:hypothetical protein
MNERIAGERTFVGTADTRSESFGRGLDSDGGDT